MLFLFRADSRLAFFSLFILATISFEACSNTSNSEVEAFIALEESLSSSNLNINRSTETVLRELNEKTTVAASAARGNAWYPKALDIQQKAKTIISYVEELKVMLKKEAGLDAAGNVLNGPHKSSVARIFKKMGKGTDLYDSLMKFKQAVFAIDKQIQTVFDSTMIFTSSSFEKLSDARQKFTHTFFKNLPAGAALALLSKFQNNIKVYENRLIQFCNNQVGGYTDHYNTYAAIVGQSSSIVKGGESIEISAGMGEFNRNAKPSINFDGQLVDIDRDGIAVYKFKTSLKPGKYVLPVKISYFDQEGKSQYLIKDIEYTVVK